MINCVATKLHDSSSSRKWHSRFSKSLRAHVSFALPGAPKHRKRSEFRVSPRRGCRAAGQTELRAPCARWAALHSAVPRFSAGSPHVLHRAPGPPAGLWEGAAGPGPARSGPSRLGPGPARYKTAWFCNNLRALPNERRRRRHVPAPI